MKHYLINGQGIESLKLVESPPPKILNDQDVLVDVKACALNYRDLKVAKGQYGGANHPPFIPLSDMAGIVRGVGTNITDLKPGDRVLNAPFRHWPAGTLRESWAQTFIGGKGVDGVLAEQIIYPSDSLFKIPAHLDFIEAATFPIAALTAWAAIVTHGKTRLGEWVLLHGSGGVSVFAAQLAHATGARVVMTTSKAKQIKERLGVNAIVNYHDEDWPEQVKKITGGKGVDVVVDVVGGETLTNSIKICNYGARIAVIGNLSGNESRIQTHDLLAHQVQLRGMFMESAQELGALMKAVESMQLKPIVDKVFPFERAQDAYRYLESQQHIGKVIIQL